MHWRGEKVYWRRKRVHSRGVKGEIDWLEDGSGLAGSKHTHGERQGWVQWTCEAREGGCQQLACDERHGKGAGEERRGTTDIFKVRIWTLL